MKSSAIELKNYYISKEFEEKYTYDGKLGAFLDEKGAHFLLWSPVAEAVRLRFFMDGDTSPLVSEVDMKPLEKGVWSYDGDTSLQGSYYDFVIRIEGEDFVTPDPYAKAAGVNGYRSQLLDLKSTDPKGWEEDVSPKKESVDVIYELNIHDFSWDEAAGYPRELRGTYGALGREKYEETKPLGLSHVKNLGVNTIQIMPMFDFASVDETGDRQQFNWGYDPLNYNVPEGSFSTNPYRGDVRIREAKEMIFNLHRMGFRVIMDVVYNHTYDLNSPLQKSCPWYFYRVDEKGNPSNGSACGNDVASEMPMCQKYIVDSVLYWAKEYHMDGFRFDLMGLHDRDCMNAVRRALDEEFGVGEKIIYGEPWKAGETYPAYQKELVTKENLSALLPGIGAFSDDIRDGIKGSVFEFLEGGFINGGKGLEKRLLQLVCVDAKNGARRISYVSCHDNHTLWDKLSLTTKDEAMRLKEYKMAVALYMLMPGKVFFLSGEEFCRSKMGEENSYNLPLSVNAINWENVDTYGDMISYYKKLIALRKSLMCLNQTEGSSAVVKTYMRKGVIGYRLKEDKKEYQIFFNGRTTDFCVFFFGGNWKVVFSSEDVRDFSSKRLPAKSVLVLERQGK